MRTVNGLIVRPWGKSGEFDFTTGLETVHRERAGQSLSFAIPKMKRVS